MNNPNDQNLTIVQPGDVVDQMQSGTVAPLWAMPIMDVAQAVARQKMLEQIVGELLVPNVDYGVIPGTQQKTLYKPGAEKLAVFFGLQPNIMLQEKEEDFKNGFFHYRYRCDIWRGEGRSGVRIATYEGSCNSHEKKYRYTWEPRPKPTKEKEADMKARKVGRNRQVWENGVQVWQWQELVEHSNPADLCHTLATMAQKRAYVGAVRQATGTTGIFANLADIERSEDADDRAKQSAGKSQGEKKTASSSNGDKQNSSGQGKVADDPVTAFWDKVRAAGIKKEDAQPIADRAIRDEITWAEAMAQLP